MNRKELKAFWAEICDEERGPSAWQKLRTNDLQQLQASVDSAKQTLAYRVLKTRYLSFVFSLALLCSLAFAANTLSGHVTPALRGEVPLTQLLLGGILVVIFGGLASALVIGIALAMLSDLWIWHITRLDKALRPLNNSLFGCAEAIKLVEESERCKAHQLAVVQEGREFLEGDLAIMRHLAGKDRHDERERNRLQACQSLHLLTTEATANA